MIRLIPLGAAVLVAAAALAGCTETKSTDEPTATSATSVAPTAATPAANRQAMLGRWTPVLPTTSSKWTTPPHVVFLQDGTWTGSDGCNEEGGRWDLEPDGSFHAEGDPSRQLGCDNVQTAVWLRATVSRWSYWSDGGCG